MTSPFRTTSSTAGIAGTGPRTPCLKPVDSPTGFRGLSPPMLFGRLGMRAGEAYSDVIASGPARRVGNRIRMADAKGLTGPVGPSKASPSAVASGQRLWTRGLHTRAGPFA